MGGDARAIFFAKDGEGHVNILEVVADVGSGCEVGEWGAIGGVAVLILEFVDPLVVDIMEFVGVVVADEAALGGALLHYPPTFAVFHN